ncbi:23S rRNA (adenine(1618)-N(6))-methyltransferase RlmF [Halopseudomonas aestusnigri]|uniref:23S rRNA (adenine(1618)-N(6))-methyltransferase RlmF n=1 Tax=Halopseudomonas TaxID=2901189 RepID=UPI000C35D12B|nr:23S rRNA (adenine(1618)-N(6))-methyltransferase RlmF [Halopseudomonas aestusnigri]MAD27088.1 23S rRNA (adenine(1618)-N(6))-methyltransferase RlmF [Pseudomonadales bacterium]MCC4259443.1 23S rRNA (adenine(1618)-N(6))-methyltransferase RlmF [Halopseudomonas aestusnigri]UGV29717.1 23S rRNA (adenine(1618)-N(6))-methyltransferase RlmF [Halopseudomonas aestusnigri]|tara:strand:+ start:494 stop:1450 length:957 start_codon:yes stop_codon:yes gene_type:complete
MSRRSSKPPALHPRNRYQGRYDFPLLARKCPPLKAFIRQGKDGQTTIDFTDPAALRCLNGALLTHWYDISGWQIPDDALCPPIPGRADLIHHLADLLASSHDGVIPKGASLRGLDVGTGANLIYPLIGNAEYGWQFVGSDIDADALRNGEQILAANPTLQSRIELRRQADPACIFTGIIGADEQFDFTLCNPPFYASAAEARQANERKWQGLGKQPGGRNFGGRNNELYCSDGEAGFLHRMAEQSRTCASQVFWFTTLVASAASLKALPEQLRDLGATDVRIIDMGQGSKRSRLLAWTFLDKKQRRAWRRARWPNTRI